MPTLATLIQHSIRSPSPGNQTRKRNNRHPNLKVKPSLSEDDMMLYKENTIDSNKNPSELVNEFSEVAGYNINNRNL